MITDGGRRIAIAGGAMLAVAAGCAEPFAAAGARIFETQYWRARGQLAAAARGRGSAWFISAGSESWALRHYRRGGLIARLCADRYLWAGEARVRAFAEWRLLALLWSRGLPVPEPIAALYRRGWLTYRCDLITRRIPQAEPLSVRLAAAPLPDVQWRAVGTAIARLHRAGVDHADLNAHNILLGAHGGVSVIDFDRGRIRPPGAWQQRNLRRLHRSLVKIAAAHAQGRFAAADWQTLMQGYAVDAAAFGRERCDGESSGRESL